MASSVDFFHTSMCSVYLDSPRCCVWCIYCNWFNAVSLFISFSVILSLFNDSFNKSVFSCYNQDIISNVTKLFPFTIIEVTVTSDPVTDSRSTPPALIPMHLIYNISLIEFVSYELIRTTKRLIVTHLLNHVFGVHQNLKEKAKTSVNVGWCKQQKALKHREFKHCKQTYLWETNND